MRMRPAVRRALTVPAEPMLGLAGLWALRICCGPTEWLLGLDLLWALQAGRPWPESAQPRPRFKGHRRKARAGIATSRKARDGRGPEQRPAGCVWARGDAWASLPTITVHASSREARIDGAGGVDARIGRPVGVEDVLRADGVAARIGLAVGIASRAALARVCAAAPTVHRAQAEGALTSATGRKARAGIATSREARGVVDECAGIATSRKARDGRGPEQRPAGCVWARGDAWASLPTFTVHASSREARIGGAGGVERRSSKQERKIV